MREYKKIVCPKKKFQKNNFKYEILNHLYFSPNLFFVGTALGRFSQFFFFFFYFSTLTEHGSRHFYSPPDHKQASYGPVIGTDILNAINICCSF